MHATLWQDFRELVEAGCYFEATLVLEAIFRL